MTTNIELGKPRADKSCAVYIRISVNSTKKRLPTNIYLLPSEYSQTKKGIRIKNLDKKSIIDDIVRKIDITYGQNVLTIDDDATAGDLLGMVKKKTRSRDFFVFADDWIKNATIKSKEDYVYVINSFSRYLGRRVLSFDEIDASLLQGYHNSLEGKPRAQSKYLAAIRHLWNQAELVFEDDMPRSPFKKFKPARQRRVGQRSTDIDTILKIFNYDGHHWRAMLARDCFILSFCTMGMNSVDLYNCEMLKKDTICYERSKVRDRREDRGYTEVKIHPFIKELFEKWHEPGKYIFKFHRLYISHRTFNTNLNRGMKIILGEKSNVTFYSARHSWASIARNELGIEKSTINDALVHVDASMDVTDLYIKKDFKLINEANKKVIEYVFASMINSK